MMTPEAFIPIWAPWLVGALALWALGPTARRITMVAIPIVGLAVLLAMPEGARWVVPFGPDTLTLARADALSFPFGLAFVIASGLAALFAWPNASRREQIATTLYAGAAVGAVFAGDWIVFFVFWEAVAFASAALVWGTGEARARRAAMRYLVYQGLSGAALFAGLVLLRADGAGLAIGPVDPQTLGGALMLAGLGIKAGFPIAHVWVKDAYPVSTPSGSVALSAFSTKLAIYALAQAFAGFTPLIFVGVVMALYPVLYAAIDNNLRRVLSYSLVSHLGFMVAAIGVGTPIALDGAIAHAFVSVIYTCLLFMCVGAAATAAGSDLATRLGGLARRMPITAACCIAGAAAMSAAPFFSGFVAKNLILTAMLEEGYGVVWALLLVASVGVAFHSGIRIPWAIFFAPRQDWPLATPRAMPSEAHPARLAAMVLASVLSLGLGLAPIALFYVAPSAATVDPYDISTIAVQGQLLAFAVLAFALLAGKGWSLPEARGVNLDIDALWRGKGWLARLGRAGMAALRAADMARWSAAVLAYVRARGWGRWLTPPLRRGAGAMTLQLASVLLLALVYFYFIHE